jgi:phosphoesterase RecJ-like protein
MITLDDIDKILREYAGKNIGIVSHVFPDGDGLAAAIAMDICLQNVYRAKPFIVMDSEFPSFLNFLPHAECNIWSYQIVSEIFPDGFDLLIGLDCHEVDRVDTDVSVFDLAKKVIFIDHHVAKPESLKPEYQYFIDSDAVSTGVIINRFLYAHVLHVLDSWKRDYADCIYTTILNDTDNFINANSDQEAFACVDSLYELGLVPHAVTRAFLYTKPISYFKFIGAVLSTIELFCDRRIVTFFSTLQMLRDNDQTLEAYSKLMRWTKGAADVEIQVLFNEYENDLHRISLRSDIHDVQKVAMHFGGGGHIRASGFQITGKFSDIQKKIVETIEKICF